MKKKNRLSLTVGVSVAILIILIAVFLLFKNGDAEIYQLKKGEFNKTVFVSGELMNSQDVDLSFRTSDIVNSINFDIGDNVKRGQVIATLNQRTILNQIAEAKSNLDAQNNKLQNISGTTNTISGNEIQISKEALITSLKKSYILSDGIIKNTVDGFFDEPESRFPKFSMIYENYFEREKINTNRYEIGRTLSLWKTEIENLNATNVGGQNVKNSVANLQKIENFLALISLGSDDMSPIDPITQAQIDAYIANIKSSRDSVISMRSEINTKSENLNTTESSVSVQQATVSSYEANLNRLYSEQSDYVIVAPFDGVITKKNIEIGKVVSVGEPAFSFAGDSKIQVETYIPEIKVADVKEGEKVVATLDAFGKDKKFDAIISHIDPTDTKKDGLTTYRAVIDFVNPDPRMRTGMTVDLEIYVKNVLDSIVIPSYLIKEDEQGKYVDVADADNTRRVNVSVDDTDGKGGSLVYGDLREGDQIIVPK